MLILLAEFLAQYHTGFNVFQYLTLRTILGVLTALFITLFLGPNIIKRLTHHQIGQPVRDDGPETHLSKAGTPTMGGVMILTSILVSTLAWSDLENRFVWIVMFSLVAFGLIGCCDDYLKLRHNDSKGLRARWKIFWRAR